MSGVEKATSSHPAADETRRLVVLGTGGTIAGKAASSADVTGYKAGEVGVAELLAGVPGMDAALNGLTLSSEQVASIDSKDMGAAVWAALLARCLQHLADPAVAALVITHGTDTLEETAFLLHTLLMGQRLTKPVVLTCAMRPATAQNPDGPQNLLDAVAVAQSGQRGVMVVCAGTVHDAARVQKVHSYRLDAFDSGPAGALGVVQAGAVTWFHTPSAAQAPSWGDVSWDAERAKIAIKNIAIFAAQNKPWPWVALVHSHADADARAVQALVDAGVRGLVVAATGNGTVHEALLPTLHDAQQRGVRVIRTSRCVWGSVVGTPTAGDLPQAGALTPVKARVALALDLLCAEAV